MSIQAKILTDMMRFFTSQQMIGPRLKDGTIRKNLIEPPWHCPDGVICLPIRMPEFQMELLTPKEGECREVILQLHGGGYIAGLRNAYRDFAVRYSSMGRPRRVLTVDYRVAPEHPYPAALEDALAAYQWLLRADFAGGDIIIAGDSAGGGLALALTMYLRDHKMPLPKKLVLMSPWTDLTASGDSYRDNYEKDPMFGNTRESMIYNGEYAGGHNPGQPYISPLFGNYYDLPPMLFQAGGLEMLLSDSESAAAKALEAGCEAELTVYPEMFHVFQMCLDALPESRKAWKEVEAFINR